MGSPSKRTARLRLLLLAASLLLFSVPLYLGASSSPKKLDPAAWGADHVGKPAPEFASGDECLFCHRLDVGPTWASNRHNLTIRPIEPKSPALAALKKSADTKEIAAEVQLIMGGSNRQRFLKKSETHGKLDLLSVEWSEKEAKLLAADRPHWDGKQFGDACAGCHATCVDVKKRTFAAQSLDCFVCHGDVPEKHTKDRTLAILAPKRKDPARVVASICGQCHIRTGTAKSSGLPYANNFVAGDNLFRDFQVDLSDEAIKKLNPADGHVLENIRDIVLFGKEDTTCLSCHDVHKQSSKKHHRVPESNLCLQCHQAEGSKKERKPYEVRSKTCGY